MIGKKGLIARKTAQGTLEGILPITTADQVLELTEAIRAAMAPVRTISAAFTSQNPVLPNGVLGIELDTHKVKIGDGTSTWNELSYIASESATPSDFLRNFYGMTLSVEDADSGDTIEMNGSSTMRNSGVKLEYYNAATGEYVEVE